MEEVIDLTISEEVETRGTSKHILEVMQSPQSKVHINTAFFSEYGEGTIVPERMQLKSHQELIQFRGGSGHDVKGYVLEVPIDDTDQERNLQFGVIVKSHNTSQKGEQEYKNVLKVRERGIRTPAPVMFVSKGGESFVVISYDPNLRSSDTIDWNIFTKEQKKKELDIFLQKYAKGLAHLNALGVYHHDAQPRNVSYDRNTSDISFFDFEASHIVDHNKHKKPEVHVPHASKDLQKVLWGFCREGIVEAENGREGALEEFSRVFLSHYFSAISAHDSRFGDMQPAVVKSLMDEFRLPE